MGACNPVYLVLNALWPTDVSSDPDSPKFLLYLGLGSGREGRCTMAGGSLIAL